MYKVFYYVLAKCKAKNMPDIDMVYGAWQHIEIAWYLGLA